MAQSGSWLQAAEANPSYFLSKLECIGRILNSSQDGWEGWRTKRRKWAGNQERMGNKDYRQGQAIGQSAPTAAHRMIPSTQMATVLENLVLLP